MAFVKEFRDVYDKFPEWEYLNRIGVRDMFNKPLEKFTTELVVDRENNYYLIPQGFTNISRETKPIEYYALCIDGKVINMELVVKSSGGVRNNANNYECHWIVEKIKFPFNWTFDIISREELKSVIIEAFTIETYTKIFTPEVTKEVTVEIKAVF